MTHFFFKLTISECKESFNSFRTLLSLSKNEICMQSLFSSMSNENDNSSSFFTTSALKCTSEVNKAY